MLSILPPHLVLRDVVSPETVAALLDHAQRHEASFKPTGVGGGGTRRRADAIRRSSGLRRLQPFRPVFEACFLRRAPALMASLGMPAAETGRLELQLVAHGDGDFYARHIDTQTVLGGSQIRLLSGVYYFHRLPRAFTGGALRLHAIGGEARFVDIEPAHNTLVVFPSWAPHEVLPVHCASGRFTDSRFSINCWAYRAAPSA